jgi:hypothetical protein
MGGDIQELSLLLVLLVQTYKYWHTCCGCGAANSVRADKSSSAPTNSWQSSTPTNNVWRTPTRCYSVYFLYDHFTGTNVPILVQQAHHTCRVVCACRLYFDRQIVSVWRHLEDDFSGVEDQVVEFSVCLLTGTTVQTLTHKRMFLTSCWRHWGSGCRGCGRVICILTYTDVRWRMQVPVDPYVGSLFDLQSGLLIYPFCRTIPGWLSC